MGSTAGLSAVRSWLAERAQLPVGPLFCVIDGPTRGVRVWSSAPVRAEFRQLRHRHAVELAREGVPLPILQRHLGHRNMATTSIYLSAIGTDEVIATVASGPAPMTSATAGLKL